MDVEDADLHPGLLPALRSVPMHEGLPRNIVLIVNPVAGGGRGKRALRDALPILKERGLDPEVHVTASGDEPPHIARAAAAAGADLVVAIGGDGHLAAVGEGLVGTDTPMAVLAAGSANDYARTIDMPRANVRAAVDAILEAQTRRVDVLRVEPAGAPARTFLNVIGTGFDAAVAAAAERITMFRGSGRYVIAIMRVLPRYEASELRLTVDGKPHTQRAMMIAIAKGPAYGGGMRVAPNASLDSGELEVCIVGELSKIAFVRAFPRVFKGTHVTHPAVTMLRGKTIEIDADSSLQLMGDGEKAGTLPAIVSVMPAALWVAMGPNPRYGTLGQPS
ncbi:MAG: diacylglycerol kinase family protein [Candidatus Limnocylindrales bacterium]